MNDIPDDIPCRFLSKNRNGTLKTCKFCHSPVWWNILEGRWYDPGGMTLHVENCELRREHFHSKAMDAAEQRRQST